MTGIASVQPVRMAPLATLPVFFKLRGRSVVMAGGDAPAVWKAELIAATGAAVTVFAADPCPAMQALAAAPPDGSIVLVRRAWQPDDLRGATLAIGAIEEREEAEAFHAAARRAGVPVNVVDTPPLCDFQFGTVVERSPLVIGISTDGAAPVFGQALRARIEALLPQNLRAWAQAAKDWRPAVQARNLDFRLRRRFWEAFTARALAAVDRAPGDADRQACFDALDDSRNAGAGQVILVGCGDGRIESLTLGAVAALQSADVVLHDADVSPTIVGMARREAEKAVFDPVDLDLIVHWTTNGKVVAWLGKGDPTRGRIWSDRRSQVESLGLGPALVGGIGLSAEV